MTKGTGFRVFTDSRTFKERDVGIRMGGALQVEGRACSRGSAIIHHPATKQQESLCNTREADATVQSGGLQGELVGGRVSEWGWPLQRGATRKVGRLSYLYTAHLWSKNKDILTKK